MEKLLEVKDLKVSFFTDLGETQAVKGAGFAIGEGDFFGIVGESGSGKSVTTKSILRLGPSNCKIMGGEILFRGEDILKKNEAELREIRGGEIAMIFQDSLSALNPVYTVGNKMVELLRRHTNMNKKEAKARVLELLTAVGITDPEKAMNSYPHELSGGMRQRVMIAMAMSSDLGVVAQTCKRVAVMCGGYVVEEGTVEEIFLHPGHPYTQALIASMPRVGGTFEQFLERDLSDGNGDLCPFLNRCKYADKTCEACLPKYYEASEGHRIFCHRREEKR